MAAKSPRRPSAKNVTPARTAPAAAEPRQEDDSEPFDFSEVVQDVSAQVAELTVQLAAARSVVRRLKREKEDLKKQLVEKSKNAPVQE